MKIKKLVSSIILSATMLVAICAVGLNIALPDTFSVVEGETLKISGMPYISTSKIDGNLPVTMIRAGNSCNVKLNLFGVIPVKTVRTQVTSRKNVMVAGTPFGIKMFSDGVMLVGFSDIYTADGYQNPAKNAGLQIGDYIQKVDGIKVKTNEEMLSIVKRSEGKTLDVEYTHKGVENKTKLSPVADKSTEDFRIGMWVRDSTAGIGTLTFIDPANGTFAGLGHSITDVDTGESFTLSTGEIVPVDIQGAKAGKPGEPGELCGTFSSQVPSGSIRVNSASGVYGKMYTPTFTGTLMETAVMQEVGEGPATILSTIDGKGVKEYDVEIERVSFNAQDANKNMIIKVTDQDLISKTGGIVQGMSGSPIIQNGRLVGAVTHVLVKDSTRGYGIFVENMMNTAKTVK